jgi:hypothetical protein
MHAQSAIHPAVRFPSQAHLNPNMSRLLDFPSQALAKGHGLAGIAVVCEGFAQGLLVASVSAPDGDLVGSADLEKAAIWFVAVSKACRAAGQ